MVHCERSKNIKTMLKDILKRSLASHHTWRSDAKELSIALQKLGSKSIKLEKFYGGFDELSELYASQLLRSLSLSLVNIFVPIYLYKLGYNLPTIFWFYVCWFAARPLLDFITGLIIARIGPKHTMALGVFVQVTHLTMLLSLSGYAWPLWLVAATGGWAYGLFILAFEVDFSKVKHAQHGGKELGFIQIFEKFGAALGPLIGGIVAGVFGPQYTIGLAILVLVTSLVPLFTSREPVAVKQQLAFEDFPWRQHKRDLFVSAMLMSENVIAIILWPLFIGVTILTVNTYETLGLVAAIGAIGSILTAYLVGKYSDMGLGRRMLRLSTALQALLHVLRLFVGSLWQVAGLTLGSELLSSGYRIPFIKGMFDSADALPGQRIVYLCFMSAANTAARLAFWLGLWALAQFTDPILVIKVGFVAGALFSLGIQLERFPSLGKNRSQA